MIVQYAKQKKIPVVPVIMQEGWRASEWLGLVTAGLLWTRLHNVSTREQDLQGLIEQIKQAVPTIAHETAEALPPTKAPIKVEDAGESEDVQALRSELDTLRRDLAQARRSSEPAKAEGDQGPHAEAHLASELAAVPAMVPALSLNVRPTPDMEKLKAMLISAADDSNATMAVTSEKNKVGALGMGGIGKTVTAAWLAWNPDIRQHFEHIVW